MPNKDKNNFGVLGADYHAARRGYPKELFDYLHSLAKIDKPITLDIGCGTGIATRQLKEFGFDVSGTDKDLKMIEVAREHSDGISYAVAPTDALPFKDETFDVVTAFTAYHWFADEKSTNEIRRVLKPGGVFFAVTKDNRHDASRKEFWKGYKEILKKYVGNDYNSMKDYDPKRLMRASGFKDIQEETFPVDELYTVEDALALNRSFSWWNIVPDNEKPLMMQELKTLYENNLVNGFLVRDRKNTAVAAYK